MSGLPDIIWRRSKLGLRLQDAEITDLANFLNKAPVEKVPASVLISTNNEALKQAV